MLEQYDDVMTVAELQEVLNIGRNTAYALLSTGTIPALLIGKRWKIPREAVMCYLRQWKIEKM